MLPTSMTATMMTTTTTTAPTTGYGVRAPQRQRLPLVITGGQDATAWLWRCVEQADHAGYDASAAEFCGRSVRAPRADLWRVRSRRRHEVIYRVSYTPHYATTTSHAHNGAWRCTCHAGAIGAACAHIGAAYLAACLWDAAQAQQRQTFTARMEQLQEQARQEADAARYYQNRYRALTAQMAALQAEAYRALVTETPPPTGSGSGVVAALYDGMPALDGTTYGEAATL